MSKKEINLFDEMAEHYGMLGLPVANNGGDIEAMLLAYLEEGDGHYDGHDEDLLPWSFDLRDLQPSESGDLMDDLSILLQGWHQYGKTFAYASLDKYGYTHLVEYEGFIYKIEISHNMGLESMDKIGCLDYDY